MSFTVDQSLMSFGGPKTIEIYHGTSGSQRHDKRMNVGLLARQPSKK
jgi:hypothetical protein